MATVEPRTWEPFLHRRLESFMAWTVLALLFPVGLMFLVRRYSGGLSAPLPPLVLVSLVAVLCGLAIWLRSVCWLPTPQNARNPAMLALRWCIPAIPLWILMGVTSVRGSIVVLLAVAWLVFLAVEGFNAWRLWGQAAFRAPVTDTIDVEQSLAGDSPISSASRSGSLGNAMPANLNVENDLEEQNEESINETLPTEATQQITRYQEANGAEAIHGLLRAVLPPGDKIANLHVAFCPPFAGTPQMFAELLEGDANSVETHVVMPYGARLDVRMGDVSQQSRNVVVEFHASYNEAPDQQG